MFSENLNSCERKKDYRKRNWLFGSISFDRLYQNGKREFPIVKDTTPQTHAYITSRTLNFGGTSHETTDFL